MTCDYLQFYQQDHVITWSGALHHSNVYFNKNKAHMPEEVPIEGENKIFTNFKIPQPSNNSQTAPEPPLHIENVPHTPTSKNVDRPDSPTTKYPKNITKSTLESPEVGNSVHQKQPHYKSVQTQTHDTNNIDQVGTCSIPISHTTLVPAWTLNTKTRNYPHFIFTTNTPINNINN